MMRLNEVIVWANQIAQDYARSLNKEGRGDPKFKDPKISVYKGLKDCTLFVYDVNFASDSFTVSFVARQRPDGVMKVSNYTHTPLRRKKEKLTT